MNGKVFIVLAFVCGYIAVDDAVVVVVSIQLLGSVLLPHIAITDDIVDVLASVTCVSTVDLK
mgnify:CR=1 FL=1